MAQLIKARKYTGMNIIDFVISYYGSLSYLDQFMQSQNYANYSDFYSDNKQFYYISIDDNFFYSNYKPVISMSIDDNIEAIFEYNNDLASKTVITGDFNSDFNSDFDINTFENVVVGFEGMNLYITWSVSNKGMKNDSITYEIQMTGYPLRTITQEVAGNSTFNFETVFENVTSGTKTITVSSVYSTQTININVLPKAIFTSNDDFAITEVAPYEDGDVINLTWSITNTGTANGIYNGIFRWSDNNGILYENEYIVPIDLNDTAILTKQLTLSSGLYTFYSTEDELININVQPNSDVLIFTYNNNLRLFNTNLVERTGNSLLWSITNTSTIAGYLNGYLVIEDTDQKYMKSFSEIKGVANILVQPNETVTFTHAFTPYASMTKATLVGYGTLNLSVVKTQISKNLLWLSSSNGFALVPNQEILNLTAGSNTFVNVNIANYSNSNKTVNVKFELDDVNILSQTNETILPLDDYTKSISVAINSIGLHYIKVYLDSLYYGIVYINII